MRRMGARAGLIALMVAVAGAAWAKDESKKVKKEVSELQEFNKEYEKAWNDNDFGKIKDLYSKNAIFVAPNGDRIVGRDDIVSGAEEMKKEGPLAGTSSQFRISSVRPLGDDLMLVTLNQHVTGLDPNMPSEYEIVSVLEKEGGDWKFIDQRSFPSRELGIGGSGQECPGTGGAGQEGIDQGVDEDQQIDEFQLDQPPVNQPENLPEDWQ